MGVVQVTIAAAAAPAETTESERLPPLIRDCAGCWRTTTATAAGSFAAAVAAIGMAAAAAAPMGRRTVEWGDGYWRCCGCGWWCAAAAAEVVMVVVVAAVVVDGGVDVGGRWSELVYDFSSV